MSHDGPEYGNFMDIPPVEGGAEKAAFHVYTIPYEKSTSYAKGTAMGPGALLEASWQVELYDMELGISAHENGIVTDRSLEELCAGGYSALNEAMASAAAKKIAAGIVPVFIGGEHTISRGPVQGALRACGELTVVHIDAHADLRDSYQDDPDSHASVMRRIMELSPSVESLVQIGIRSMCPEELEYSSSDSRISMFPAHDVIRGRVSYEDILSMVSGNVYLSIDLDGIDPSEVPGVGTPEPGGLSWQWTVDFIDQLCASSKVVAFDVVELMPLNCCNRSDFLAAKLTYRTMGLILKHRHR